LLNFCWKLFEWIRDHYEKTRLDLLSYELVVLNRLPLSKDKTGLFIMSPYPRVLSGKIKLCLGRTIAMRLVHLTASGIFDRRDYTV